MKTPSPKKPVNFQFIVALSLTLGVCHVVQRAVNENFGMAAAVLATAVVGAVVALIVGWVAPKALPTMENL